MSNVTSIPVNYRFKSVISNPRYKASQKKMNDLASQMIDNISKMEKSREDDKKFLSDRSGWDEQ